MVIWKIVKKILSIPMKNKKAIDVVIYQYDYLICLRKYIT